MLAEIFMLRLEARRALKPCPRALLSSHLSTQTANLHSRKIGCRKLFVNSLRWRNFNKPRLGDAVPGSKERR